FIDDDGFRLAESNTIMRYLAGKWGLDDWYSPDPKERALIDQWMEFGAQHLNLPLGELYVSRWFAARFNWTMDLYAIDRALKDLARNLPLLDERLGRTPYVAAPHPTLADLVILPFMMMAECAGLPLGAPYPRIASWLTTMIRRPSWKEVADPRWPVADA